MRPDDEAKKNDRIVPTLTGVILIGGKSVRMGTDKSEMHYHGQSQRRRLFDLLSPFCSETVFSCNVQQTGSLADLPLIKDQWPETGPMGGITSVFEIYSQSALLTVPCDLPWLDHETIACLVDHRNPNKMATTYWNSDRQTLEPLLTIWEPAAFPILQSHLQQGQYSPYKLLRQSDVEVVTVLNPKAFENVNTQEEFKRVTEILKDNAKKSDPDANKNFVKR